ncbi:MAG TPA: sensor histidine kinase [Gaiellales bacterium]
MSPLAATERWLTRRARWRVGQVLGLVFLTGPVMDLASAGQPLAQGIASWACVAAFVALYLVLLPPVHAVARRGERAIWAALGLLAALAAIALLLGAPSSLALLFVYVVTVAGMQLRPAPAGVVVAVAAAAVATGLALSGSDGSAVAAYALTVLGVGATMAALGSSLRANDELREARGELARLAVSDERLRIARDMHDLLGHTLSLVALKSDLAARLVRSDPERAEAEMNDVRSVTRQALEEVRSAVHGYRQLPFASALDGARAALSAAGIDCRVEGAPPQLATEVESVLAWALREATTNVVRHSGAHGCAITLEHDPEAVSLLVVDDGAATSGATGEGAGLVGLAERARGLNGTLEAGARPGGGYRLRLTLPRGAA